MPTSWSSLYLEWNAGMTDYIARHLANYSRIQTCLDYLHAIVGGGRTLLDVPLGLQEIYDRKGIIGKHSYRPPEGSLLSVGDVLTIPGGAYWSGSTFVYKTTDTDVVMGGFPTGDYFVNLDAAGNPSVSDTHTTDCVWWFHWENHTVSLVLIQSGVAILFDGHDYNDCLYSEELSRSFESIADRFENLEENISLLTHLQVNPECIGRIGNHTFEWFAGRVRNDNQIWEIFPDSDVILTPGTSEVDEMNYVEVDPATGNVVANTVGFTSGSIPLYLALCDDLQIKSVTDKRAWLSAGGGGGGGGHTQNTDVGTVSSEFKLNMDEPGVPSENCSFSVERGTSPNVAIRWNESADKWQFTEDGTNWSNIGTDEFDLGAQAISKYIPVDNPPLVHEELSRGPSSIYEEIDLSSHILDAPDGVDAVLLRVVYWDTENPPTVDSNVRFRKGGIGQEPLVAYTIYSPAQKDWSRPQAILVGTSTDFKVEFFLNASGLDTANIRVYLTGYFKKILGVGTQNVSLTNSGMVVPANSSAEFNIPLFANRALVHYLKTEETGGLVTGTYDIEIFSADTFGLTELLYQAIGMDPTVDYEDWLPWWHSDDDLTRELHIRITNRDLTQQGTFAITVRCEMFN